MSSQIVATGVRFGEGPVWCGDGTLVVTSVCDGMLLRVDVSSGEVTTVTDTAGGPNAAYPASDGGFVVTQNGGIDFTKAQVFKEPPPYHPATPGLQRVLPDGTAHYLCDTGFLAPNDLVTAADGTLYFTDPPHHPPPPEPLGRVHALHRDGTTSVIASGFHYCNGIALEPDGTIVVVEGKGLMRVHLDGTTEWVTEVVGQGGDGFCLDVEGNFYVAATRDHGIRVVSPGGKDLDFFPIPDPPDGFGIVTNCCFGGDDGRTLFATDGIPGWLVAWEHMPVPGREVHPWPVP